MDYQIEVKRKIEGKNILFASPEDAADIATKISDDSNAPFELERINIEGMFDNEPCHLYLTVETNKNAFGITEYFEEKGFSVTFVTS